MPPASNERRTSWKRLAGASRSRLYVARATAGRAGNLGTCESRKIAEVESGVTSAGVAPTARAKAEQVKSLAAENIKKRHIALQLGSVSAACSESSALRIEARCAGAPGRQGVAQGWFRREPDPGAADVVITAPRNDLAFDLEDLGADRLEAV